VAAVLGLEQRDLRNLNLGDLKKVPNGGVNPTQKKGNENGNAIRVPGRGRPQGCETSRIPHFLDTRATDDGEIISLTRRPPFTPRKIPGTQFC
jgi:hypothetical protein